MKTMEVETNIGLNYKFKIDNNDEIESIRTNEPTTKSTLFKGRFTITDIVLKTKHGKTFSVTAEESDNIQSLEINEIIKFKVETNFGRVWVRATPSTPVFKIKKFIADRYRIPKGHQTIYIHNGTLLCDASLLSDYNVTNNSIISVATEDTLKIS